MKQNPHVIDLVKVIGDLMEGKPLPAAGSEAFDRMNRAVLGMQNARGGNPAAYIEFGRDCLLLLLKRAAAQYGEADYSKAKP